MSKTNTARTQHRSIKAQSADIRYQVDDAHAELANVEAEVDRVTVVLAGLLSRVNYLKAQINASNSPFLRMLPSELITEIFTLCLGVPAPDQDPRNVDNTVPLKLGAVCHGFRTIAWSTPQLWATVILDIKSSWKIAAQTTLLFDWLSRSGHLPLSIWLNSTEEVHWTSEQILKVINVFCDRWKYIDIRLPSSCYQYLPSSNEPLPMLESLTLKPPGGQGDRSHRVHIRTAPNLRYITLQCLYLRSIRFQWHLLTFLDLESFYIDESIEIFRQASNLVGLYVRRILGGDDNHALPSEPIIMPSLSSLTFVNDKATDLSIMLDMLTLPALRSLSFSTEGTSPCLSLARVIQRSSCRLASLTLKHWSGVDPDFVLLLSCTPSVKELCLEMFDTTIPASRSDIASLTDDVLQLIISREIGHDHLLPNLEMLSYTGLQQFTWAKMFQMIESRTVGTSTSGDLSTYNELRHSDTTDPVSTHVSVTLRAITLRLTLSSEEEVAAIPAFESFCGRDTRLKWSLETVVKT